MRALAIVAATLALAGCNTPHQIVDRSDFLAEGTRTYRGEARERIVEAAEMVLKVSDPNDFEFRHSLNGFTGLRRYMVYAIVASQTGREKWDFLVEPEANGALKAAISVSEAGTTYGNYTATPYENRMASVPLYRLFWDRVDYVLGKREDWTTCEQAAAALQGTQTNATAALGGLCGPTSDGRNSPPPPQMEIPRTPAIAGRARRAT